MNPAQFIEMPYWEIAGWTMLHFLWAGSLLAVAAAGGRFSVATRGSAGPLWLRGRLFRATRLDAGADRLLGYCRSAGSFAIDERVERESFNSSNRPMRWRLWRMPSWPKP